MISEALMQTWRTPVERWANRTWKLHILCLPASVRSRTAANLETVVLPITAAIRLSCTYSIGSLDSWPSVYSLSWLLPYSSGS